MEILPKYKIRRKIFMDSDIFYSRAYQCLGRSASAINTLLRCLQKRKWENVKFRGRKQIVYSNESFVFPYTEAKAVLGIGTTQHWKNIRKLVEVGFLDVEYQGGWYQKHEKEKDYSRYKFSDRWRKYGTLEFVKVEKEKVLPTASHIRENMARQKLKVTSLHRRRRLHFSEGVRGRSDNSRLHSREGVKMAIKNHQSLASAT